MLRHGSRKFRSTSSRPMELVNRAPVYQAQPNAYPSQPNALAFAPQQQLPPPQQHPAQTNATPRAAALLTRTPLGSPPLGPTVATPPVVAAPPPRNRMIRRRRRSSIAQRYRQPWQNLSRPDWSRRTNWPTFSRPSRPDWARYGNIPNAQEVVRGVGKVPGYARRGLKATAQLAWYGPPGVYYRSKEAYKDARVRKAQQKAVRGDGAASETPQPPTDMTSGPTQHPIAGAQHEYPQQRQFEPQQQQNELQIKPPSRQPSPSPLPRQASPALPPPPIESPHGRHHSPASTNPRSQHNRPASRSTANPPKRKHRSLREVWSDGHERRALQRAGRKRVVDERHAETSDDEDRGRRKVSDKKRQRCKRIRSRSRSCLTCSSDTSGGSETDAARGAPPRRRRPLTRSSSESSLSDISTKRTTAPALKRDGRRRSRIRDERRHSSDRGVENSDPEPSSQDDKSKNGSAGWRKYLNGNTGRRAAAKRAEKGKQAVGSSVNAAALSKRETTKWWLQGVIDAIEWCAAISRAATFAS